MSQSLKRGKQDFEENPAKRVQFIVKELKGGSLANKDVKARILQVLRVVCTYIFSAPFLRCTNKNVEEKEIKTFEDVMLGVENDEFKTVESVFATLEEIIEQTIIKFADMKQRRIGKSRLHFTDEDVLTMASELRKKISKLRTCFFPEPMLQRASTIYPKKMNEKVRFHKFIAPRGNVLNSSIATHFYISAYYFHKMITKLGKLSVPLRRLINLENAITSITHIENEKSAQTFENQKRKFEEEKIVDVDGHVKELFLFHGTSLSNLHRIASENFIIDATPIQKSTQNDARKKTMIYGQGIYLTELPALSLTYGNGLLLCKVLPGRCDVITPRGGSVPPIPEYCDSREIKQNRNSVLHILKNASQILPYCIIELNEDSLTDELIKFVKN